ncbi:MAG: hypothetical protein GY797_36970 [Deltaproteobacteria bacterium]|nr:hypothetical protein [Deltaproteobacteria bacterium]
MAREELIGKYGKYASAAVGTDVSTGTLTANALYIVVTIGGTSTLPTGVEVGYAFVAAGTEDISSSGDVVKPLTLTDQCDITSWSMEFSKDEVEVTTLCSDFKKYLDGRTDTTGSAEGIYTIGRTDTDGGLANKFYDIVRQAGAGGTVTIDKIDDSEIVAILYLQKDQTAGETEQFFIVPASVTTFGNSVTLADAQTFSSSFRQAPNDEIKFQLVSVVHS